MATTLTHNKQGYGIGTYQPLANYTQYGGGFPSSSFALAPPGAGNYGGDYGFILDTRIRAPAQVSYAVAPSLGLDGTGLTVIRGFDTMTWAYGTLRPDYWYYLLSVYKQSARTTYAFQYLVLVQYLDPEGSGTLLRKLAWMDPPTHSHRDVAAYYGVQLVFRSIGKQKLAPNTPIVVVS